MPVRVLLVDEHQAVREGLRVLFAGRGVEIAHAVSSGGEALQAVAAEEADLVLLDLRLPDVPGLVALQQLKALRPPLPVLIHTSMDAMQYALRSLQLGASGFLRKGDRGERLVAAARYVARGGALWKPSELERAASLATRNSRGAAFSFAAATPRPHAVSVVEDRVDWSVPRLREFPRYLNKEVVD